MDIGCSHSWDESSLSRCGLWSMCMCWFTRTRIPPYLPPSTEGPMHEYCSNSNCLEWICTNRSALVALWRHLRMEALQSLLPHTAAQKQIWERLLQQLGSRLCPRQGSDSQRTKKRPHPISSAASGHHNTSHTPYQGDNGQRTMKKNAAGIYTKTALAPKILDSHVLCRDDPTQKQPFETTVCNCIFKIHTEK